MVSKLDLKGSDWILAPRAHYRFSDLKEVNRVTSQETITRIFLLRCHSRLCSKTSGLQNGPQIEAQIWLTYKWYSLITFLEPSRTTTLQQKDGLKDTRNLFIFLIFQWLPLVEASHFRHGMIIWAPTDSYSNTVRAEYIFTTAHFEVRSVSL